MSIHATDPELRARLLRNRRGATSLRWLAALLDAGIEVHGQVVVCPGINDGDVLDDTLLGVLDRFPRARDGRRRAARRERPHHRARDATAHPGGGGARSSTSSSAWQARFVDALGRRLVYASDEYYLLAGRPFPALDAYDDLPAARERHRHGRARSKREVRAALAGQPTSTSRGPAPGSSPGSTAPRPRATAHPRRRRRSRHRIGARARRTPTESVARNTGITLLTGEYGAPGARAAAPRPRGRRRCAGARWSRSPNRFFGGNIGVTGLLTGADVARAARRRAGRASAYLLPDVVLSNGRFLDGTTLADLPRPVEIVATDGASLVARCADRGHDARRAPGRRGRRPPNVGKSTLVNRFVGRRDAIVEEQPGVTRDRKELEADWNGRSFRVVDTGGWLAADLGRGRRPAGPSGQRPGRARRSPTPTSSCSSSTSPSASPRRTRRSRRSSSGRRSPCSLVANKVDDERREPEVWAFAPLGLGDPHPVSAIHGRGSGDLLDALVDVLPRAAGDAGGRRDPNDRHASRSRSSAGPNVGKSTLFNRLVGDERSVVHDLPGTTRDAIDTVVETEDGPLRFVDTAGMRRRSRIDEPTEYFCLVRALQAVDRADAALLVIDAPEGVTPPGPAARRARRRRRHRDRHRPQQVGPARRRRAGQGQDRRRRPARVPRLRAGAHGLGADRAR